MSDYFFDSSVLDVVDGWVKKGKGKLIAAVEAVNHEEHSSSVGGTKGLGFKGTSKKEAQAAADNDPLKTIISSKTKHVRTSSKHKLDDYSDEHMDGVDGTLEVSRTAIGSSKKRNNESVEKEMNKKTKSSKGDTSNKAITEVDKALITSDTLSHLKPAVAFNPCRNFMQTGLCQFGSKCRFSHDGDTTKGSAKIANITGVDTADSSVIHQRKRKKTRSKQKNIRKDHRPDGVKPAFDSDGNYIGRPLTVETKRALGRDDVVDDNGVYRSKPKSTQNIIAQSAPVAGVARAARDVGKGGRDRSRSRGSSLGGSDEDVGWSIDTKKY